MQRIGSAEAEASHLKGTDMKGAQVIVLIAFMALIGFLAWDSDSSSRAVYFGLIGGLLVIALIAVLAFLARSAQADAQKLYFGVISTLVGFIAGIAGGTAAGTAAGTEAGDSAADDVKSELATNLQQIQGDVKDVATQVENLDGAGSP
jgi:hypothetical protein